MADVVFESYGGMSRRMQEVASGEYAPESYVVNGATAALARGRMFVAGTGKLTLAAAGNFRATFTNPAASGRTCYIVRLAALSNTGPAWARMYRNPDTNLPSSGAVVNNNVAFGHPTAAVAEVKADTSLSSALGGGVDTGIDLGVPAGERVEITMAAPFVLGEGVSLGINVPFAGAADMSLSVYWFEEDV